MRRLLTYALMVTSVTFAACVDREFDLGNLNTEISIGDGQVLDLPIGHFSEKTLEQIIGLDENNHLFINDNGDYIFMLEDMDGSIGIGFPQKADIPAIDASYPIQIGSITEGYTGPIPAGEASGSISRKTDLTVTARFADYLKSIDRIIFKPDEGMKTASMKLRLKLNTLATANADATFIITVTAPEGMEMYDGDTGTGKSTIVRTLNIPEGETMAETTVNIKDIYLRPEQYTLDEEKNFLFESSFRFDVDYSFTSKYAEVVLAQLPSLDVEAKLEYQGADIELADHDFEKEESEVEVGSITGGYDVTINNLDINPTIYLRVGNSFPVKAKVRISLSYEGESVSVDDIGISEARCEDGVFIEKGLNNIVLAPTDPHEGDEFYEFDFRSLFEGDIPEKLDIGLDARVKPGKYTIYADDYYSIDYAYRIELPLRFGNDFSLTFSTETSGFESSMNDLKDLTARNAYLHIDMYNAMPLSASLPEDGLILLDGNGEQIDPTLASVRIKSGTMEGSTDGKERHSQLVAQLYLKDGKLEHLRNLSRIRLTLDAESVGENLSLNKNQKVYGAITIHLEDGVQIKL